MMRAPILLAMAIALASIVGATAQPVSAPIDQRAIMAATPPPLLSAYHFFSDPGARQPSAGVTPYDLNTALYSDGALKFRYLYLPPGQAARFSASDVFGFPVGAVLIKTFAFAADMRAPGRNVRFLETRLLIHRLEGWVALAYVWNDAQTEARLSPIGATVPVSLTDTDGAQVAFDWAVPNRNQCTGCHAREGGGAVLPLGPTARNLNRHVFYPGHGQRIDGPSIEANSQDQLQTWLERGLIDRVPADAPRAASAYEPISGTVEARARAYLQVNCAHCHNPNGPAHTSGLDLRDGTNDPPLWGVLKRPVAAGRGSSNMDFDIAPGHPDQSILVYRMASTDPGEMMPELGRQMVDQRAIALMRDWIAGMGPDGRPKR